MLAADRCVIIVEKKDGILLIKIQLGIELATVLQNILGLEREKFRLYSVLS